jgi:hypothetical protein
MGRIVDLKYLEEYALLKAKRSAIVSQVQDTIYWNSRKKNKARYELLKQLDKQFEEIQSRLNEIENSSYQRR